MLNLINITQFPASPEAFLLSMIAVVLIADLGTQRAWISYCLSQVTIIGCFILVACLYHTPTQVLFSGHFIWDSFACLIKLATLAISFPTLIYIRSYTHAHNSKAGDYYLLILFSLLGSFVIASGYHLLTLYLGLELMSLPLYALVALERKRPDAAEAAMKYILLGALASALLLYGFSLIYSISGTLTISKLTDPFTHASTFGLLSLLVLTVAWVLVISGIAFKLGIAPFHSWVPDVYQAAPIPVALLIGTVPKLAMIGFVARLSLPFFAQCVGHWTATLFASIACVSLVLGNCVAILQTNLKRLLGYSAIAHLGYATLGLTNGQPAGYAMALFYLITYAIMALGAFGLLLMSEKKPNMIENIQDLKGLSCRNPWFAFLALFVVFSMAGIPPTVGFFAKVTIIELLVKAGNLWLAGLALVTSVIGAYYYLILIKTLYFDQTDPAPPLALAWDVRLVLNLSAFMLLILGLFPEKLITLCQTSIEALTPVIT